MNDVSTNESKGATTSDQSQRQMSSVSVKTSTSYVDKNKMPCVIENSKPRKQKGRLFITSFLVLVLSLLMTFCLMDSDGDSVDIKSFLNMMLLPFIPLLTGIYLHYFMKANTMEEFKKHFSMINAKEKVNLYCPKIDTFGRPINL